MKNILSVNVLVVRRTLRASYWLLGIGYPQDAARWLRSRRLCLVPFALCLISVISATCRHKGRVEVTCSENEHYYSMVAVFDPGRMRSVENYMNDRIGYESNMSFINTRIDDDVALDDHTTFYIKKHDGFLEIKLDKIRNSRASYEEIKSMCQGILSKIN